MSRAVFQLLVGEGGRLSAIILKKMFCMKREGYSETFSFHINNIVGNWLRNSLSFTAHAQDKLGHRFEGPYNSVAVFCFFESGN